MEAAELLRYKKRLLEKQQELLFPDAEAELQIRLHQSDSHLLPVIDDALARMRQGTYVSAASARSRSMPQPEEPETHVIPMIQVLPDFGLVTG